MRYFKAGKSCKVCVIVCETLQEKIAYIKCCEVSCQNYIKLVELVHCKNFNEANFPSDIKDENFEQASNDVT